LAASDPHDLTGIFTPVGGEFIATPAEFVCVSTGCGHYRPNTSTVHILVNPNNAGVLQDIPAVAAIAGKIGLGFEVVQAGTESEIDAAFAALSRNKAQALMVANDAFFTIRGAQIAALAARYALPALYPWREQAAPRRQTIKTRKLLHAAAKLVKMRTMVHIRLPRCLARGCLAQAA
jgi:hypothetical protein